jgi:hypothetical protein
LLPLLAFAAALFFKDVVHPERITLALALLMNVSLHGILLAACIGLAYLLQAARHWKEFPETTRKRYIACVGAILLLLIVLYAVLKPAPDVQGWQDVQHRSPSLIVRMAWDGINGAFFDYSPLTVAWLLALAIWCFSRKGTARFLPLAAILVLGVFYGFYGLVHHQGTIFVAAIAGMWILWPTSAERSRFSSWQRYAHQAFAASLICLLAYQVWNAQAIIRNDYRYPYCGAADTARYLKSVGADRQPIVGYLYGMVAVEAYFDHNIQANRPTAYFHHGQPFVGVLFDDADFQTYHPEYVVVPGWYNVDYMFQTRFEPYLRAHGYHLVHFSDGYLFSKRGWAFRQVYFTFRRDSK